MPRISLILIALISAMAASKVQAIQYEGELSILNATDNRGAVIARMQVRWKIGLLMGEPVKKFILNWEPGDGFTHLNDVVFRAKVGSGAYIKFGIPYIGPPDKWGFDVWASPAWNELFQNEAGSFLSEDAAKTIFKQGVKLSDLEVVSLDVTVENVEGYNPESYLGSVYRADAASTTSLERAVGRWGPLLQKRLTEEKRKKTGDKNARALDPVLTNTLATPRQAWGVGGGTHLESRGRIIESSAQIWTFGEHTYIHYVLRCFPHPNLKDGKTGSARVSVRSGSKEYFARTVSIRAGEKVSLLVQFDKPDPAFLPKLSIDITGGGTPPKKKEEPKEEEPQKNPFEQEASSQTVADSGAKNPFEQEASSQTVADSGAKNPFEQEAGANPFVADAGAKNPFEREAGANPFVADADPENPFDRAKRIQAEAEEQEEQDRLRLAQEEQDRLREAKLAEADKERELRDSIEFLKQDMDRLRMLGRYNDMRRTELKLAEKGDADAQLRIAEDYMSAKKADEAKPWFDKALARLNELANAGDPKAQYEIGRLINRTRWSDLQLIGKTKDERNEWYERAYVGYKKMAEGGDIEAMGIAADIYKERYFYLPGREDSERYWWKRERDAYLERAEAGDIHAIRHLFLGKLHEFRVTPEWREKRAAAERELAEKGDAEAQHNWGNLCLVGSGVEQDAREAVKWLTKAAEQGYVPSMYGLFDVYRWGTRDGFVEDFDEAVKWAKKAIEMGSARAMYELGMMYGESGGHYNKEEQLKWIRKSANEGYSPALTFFNKGAVKDVPEIHLKVYDH